MGSDRGWGPPVGPRVGGGLSRRGSRPGLRGARADGCDPKILPMQLKGKANPKASRVCPTPRDDEWVGMLRAMTTPRARPRSARRVCAEAQ